MNVKFLLNSCLWWKLHPLEDIFYYIVLIFLCMCLWLVHYVWETSYIIVSMLWLLLALFQLSIYEEPVYAFWYYLVIYMWGTRMCLSFIFLYLSTHIFIHQVTMSISLESWWWLIVYYWSVYGWHWLIYLSYVDMNIYMMHLIDLVYKLLVYCMFPLESVGYLLRVGNLVEAHHVNLLLNDYFV